MKPLTLNNRLAGFIYELLRDGCPAGVIEKIVRNEEEIGPEITSITVSNGHLGSYALELADRLEKAFPTKDES